MGSGWAVWERHGPDLTWPRWEKRGGDDPVYVRIDNVPEEVAFDRFMRELEAIEEALPSFCGVCGQFGCRECPN